MTNDARNETEGPILSRDQVVSALSEHFAADHIEMEELERRLDVAHRATTPTELRELLADLPTGVGVPAPLASPSAHPAVPGGSTARGIPGPGNRVAAEHEVRDSQVVVGFWGGSSRGGSWVPARRINAVALQGGVELDFREARFGPGVTRLRAFAVMGGLDIVVPPDLRVECDGIGVMGAFEQTPDPAVRPDPDGPVLRISGLAVWGAVEVTVRRSGETSRDARLRRREYRKQLKAEAAERRRLGR
jgi:hypothetical protein